MSMLFPFQIRCFSIKLFESVINFSSYVDNKTCRICSIRYSFWGELKRRHHHNFTKVKVLAQVNRTPFLQTTIQQLHTCIALRLFWQEEKKDGYSKVKEKLKQTPKIELIRDGLKELKLEIIKWKDEIKEKLEMDPILIHRPGEIDVVFKFDTKEKLENWIVTSDSDHNQGLSTSNFVTTHQGTGLFSGEVNTKPPLDGKVKSAGYCNITSARIRKSFKREDFYDWTRYTHIVFRIRGDGRSYMVNLMCVGPYDIMWNDIYHFVLYTRGGPYWQVAKIPFSRFFFGSKGRVQDCQKPVPLDQITNVGITVADKIDGPFHLEIDYIGVEFDPNHTETFAYEMYQVEKYLFNT